jgi:hypothetical protein
LGGSGDGPKCSICHGRFATPQDFYEHLDDCVLNVIVPAGVRPQLQAPRRYGDGVSAGADDAGAMGSGRSTGFASSQREDMMDMDDGS